VIQEKCYSQTSHIYLEKGTPIYLSCVKDCSTREILAYYLSTSLVMGLVYRTLENLIEALDGNVHPEAIIHSDQGVHYTNPEYQFRVKKLGFTQSMSQRKLLGQWTNGIILWSLERSYRCFVMSDTTTA
jgi:transposase InsO family protein